MLRVVLAVPAAYVSGALYILLRECLSAAHERAVVKQAGARGWIVSVLGWAPVCLVGTVMAFRSLRADQAVFYVLTEAAPPVALFAATLALIL